MGTRSLTIFKDDRAEIVVMYRQFDGYPEGHGSDLAKLLSGMKLVNGLPAVSNEKMANGIGCLAAQVVASLKVEPGGIYLYPAGTRDCGEEYIYTVYGSTHEEPRIKLNTPWEEDALFDDYASEFGDFINMQDDGEV